MAHDDRRRLGAASTTVPGAIVSDVAVSLGTAQPCRCGRNSCSLVLTPSLITPQRSWSPASSALAASVICSKVAWGGIGGTFGSQRTSKSVGRLAPSARSQAGAMSSGLSTAMAASPRLAAKAGVVHVGQAL